MVGFAAQALAYAHARTIAEAAAQDGARDAASGGPQAGISRARGDPDRGRRHRRQPPRHRQRATADEVTSRVEGRPPRLFSLPLLLPTVHASASLPVERYPADEQAAHHDPASHAGCVGRRGRGSSPALLLLAGVLLPLMFLVPLFARIEQGRLAAEQAARDAVRAASQAALTDRRPSRPRKRRARPRPRSKPGCRSALTLEGELQRGATLTAQTTVEVPLGGLPFFGRLGTISVHGRARAPVDQYRSLDPNAEAAP